MKLDNGNFEEYVMKSCEDAIGKSETYLKLNSEIISVENKFRKTLNREQLKIFNQHEQLVIELESCGQNLLYKLGHEDGINWNLE